MAIERVSEAQAVDLTRVIAAISVQEMRLLGSFKNVKRCLESTLDCKLGVRSWPALYGKVQLLIARIGAVRVALTGLDEDNILSEAKHDLYRLLNVRFQAHSNTELRQTLETLIKLFGRGGFDPFQYYESTKLKKFRDSSRLEGIHISVDEGGPALEQVLAKHRWAQSG